MDRVAIDLRRHLEKMDEEEKAYDPNDLSGASMEELVEAFNNMPSPVFMRLLESVREECEADVGLELLMAVKNYRKLG